jgi:hypothetical protein
VAQEVLHQLLTDRNLSSHLTFQIQCTSQYFQATSTEQIIKREKGKWQVSQSKLTNLSNSFGSLVLHHMLPFRLQPSTRFQKWSPKISLKSTPFPLIPSTTKPNPPKKKKTQRQTNQKENKIKQRCITSINCYCYCMERLRRGIYNEEFVCFLSLESNGSFLSWVGDVSI